MEEQGMIVTGMAQYMAEGLRVTEKRYALSESEGEMRVYGLLPGIFLCFNEFSTRRTLPEGDGSEGMMEMNYCLRGGHYCEFEDGTASLLNERDFCINMFSNPALNANFPMGYYKGIGLIIHMDEARAFLKSGIPGISVDIDHISKRLCLDSMAYYLSDSDNLNALFTQIYEAQDDARFAIWRLKIVELLLYLDSGLALKERQEMKYYPVAVVRATKAVCKHIVDHYDAHVSIDQLAGQFGVSPTMLKECFRALYGKPIYTWKRNFRMQEAARLLREEALPIGLIAERVGYQSAGKFASAFKQVMGLSPRDYRQSTRADKKIV